MGRKRGFITNGMAVLMGLLLLALSQTAAAQDAKPQESMGLTVDAKTVLGLGPQIPAMEGYALRVRQITMEPGAVVAYHDHAHRPIAVYVVSGEFTEVPDSGPAITRGPGSQWVEGAEMKHWGANRGQVPTVLIAVDLIPEE